MKSRIAALGIRAALPALESSDSALDRALALAARRQLGRASESELVDGLRQILAGVDREWLADEIALGERRAALEAGPARRSRILETRSDGDGWRRRYTPRGRRFQLLRHLGIEADVWICRAAEVIAAHAHHRICAAMLILEGELELELYHRVRELPDDRFEVEPRFSGTIGPGEVTISSEHRDNIHAIRGVTGAALAFRLELGPMDGPAFSPRLDQVDGLDPREVRVEVTGTTARYL